MKRKYTKRDWLPQLIALIVVYAIAAIAVPCDGKSCDNEQTHYTE